MDLSDSDQSLASHISGDPTGGEPGSQSQPKGRKEPAHWRLEEEVSFLRYLYDNRTGTDGLTFPKKTYMGAAVHIAQEFKNQKGGLKTDGVCKSKFSSLKSAYFAAQAIKVGGSASGFTWTDKEGATIDENTASAWAGYVKVSTALPQITALDPNLIFSSPIQRPNNSRPKDSTISRYSTSYQPAPRPRESMSVGEKNGATRSRLLLACLHLPYQLLLALALPQNSTSMSYPWPPMKSLRIWPTVFLPHLLLLPQFLPQAHPQC